MSAPLPGINSPNPPALPNVEKKAPSEVTAKWLSAINSVLTDLPTSTEIMAIADVHPEVLLWLAEARIKSAHLP